ncbi:SPOSA6832_03180, partial [Sporobolomyces salmonicolor]
MATAQQAYSVDRSKQNKGADPYQYQVGFGNSFASEAIPDVLPVGQNSPQKVKFGLYAEQVTATAFVAPRHQNQKLWLYRMRPSVAHQGFVRIPENPDMCSEFSPLNPKVSVSPTQIAWRPFPLPPSSQKVDFVEGLKTIAGTGSPMEKTGLAIHMYLANTSMDKKAFINNDGDMLIVPQQGRLDIQTELGHLMVAPGEICVIQRGLRFKVNLPDGPSRGFIQEIFGTHYKLPELGPLGANGLANARDFEHPVASFEVDQSGWLIVYKLMGTMWACSQEHSPFDVVAWHGNYVPYKYDLSRFCVVGSVSFDHIDPSICACFSFSFHASEVAAADLLHSDFFFFPNSSPWLRHTLYPISRRFVPPLTVCVLTVDSNEPGTPLADLLVFSPRWDVATHTFRPPYFHRNAASEFMAAIFGGYEGRSDDFLPGGASYECGFTPHGVSHEVFKEASEIEQSQPQFISQGTVAVMFESSRQFTLTDYAVNRSGTIHYHEPKMWDPLVSEFVERLDEVNEHLAKHGLPPISKGNATAGNQGLARRTVEGESAMEGSSH